MRLLRTAFMGSPEFAVPSFLATAKFTDLQIVVTQPDRPGGRGQKMQAPAIKLAAEKAGYTVLQPETLRDGTCVDQLRLHKLDLVVVVAYGRILGRDMLNVATHGCINVHASLLPRWRGAAPIQRAILAGDANTGVSIMQLDEGCDTGPVYTTVSTEIRLQETSGELFDRLAIIGGDCLGAFLENFENRGAALEQDSSLATHASKLCKQDGEIQWEDDAQNIVNRVRAVTPWPGGRTQLDQEQIKVFGLNRSAATEGEHRPGTLVLIDETGIHVACGVGAVCIPELQPSGKRRMSADSFIRGRANLIGQRFQTPTE